MKTYTAKEVEELVIDAVGYAIEKYHSSDSRSQLTQQFLKDKGIVNTLEVGKWYKIEAFSDKALVFMTKEYTNNNSVIGYGFTGGGRWTDEWYMCHSDKWKLTEATNEEVEKALIKEAKRRGFKEGVRFKCLIDGNTSSLSEVFEEAIYFPKGYNRLLENGGCFFKDGKWATIIDKPREMTVAEIAEKLGHEIEIVK